MTEEPGTPDEQSQTISRREFARLASYAAVLAACSSDAVGPTAPNGSGITISGTMMTIPLAQNPSLAQSGGVILVSQARAIVIRLSATEFRTLTSICTHEGCTVSGVRGARLVCPCHGSEYEFTGAVARGPAATALRSYATTFDAGTGVVTVMLV
ncbi:MAG: ubiquinol-cytochrome c reductase iron-sulfur subunit [Gemmatimonadaceae bacterium]